MSVLGFLEIDVRPSKANYGAFKSCHPCFFRRTHPALVSVGGIHPLVSSYVELVAKRFIRIPDFEVVPDPNEEGAAAVPEPSRPRYELREELVHCYTELKTLYYASALHEQVYVLMRQALTKALVACPFEIPVLTYAAAGAAMSIAHGNKDGVWIIEQKIEGHFYKYINNNSLRPNSKLKAAYYRIAVFLCFCQHMQYIFTEKRCIITDYQGTMKILTDAQISTREEDAEHFSRGNITSLLNEFPTTHICNEWCDFFGIGEQNKTPAQITYSLRGGGREAVCDPDYGLYLQKKIDQLI
ncbi:hypothetical protein SISSUDRAFT_994771 [Sistotremastrum suecicum HHB10207 ss-3]|uniref:Alpha-type protein kinase domain-containing protein n=1 Tax=Sistotremastrum suecicum HHB10207 ss-3 TaxID=1314776 RepID=A0A165X0Q1_9AGAM|nr:hypothetical protein SISSUDRAFT_994771 [Sistotremastrum suecicum HHB10207 ss-3]